MDTGCAADGSLAVVSRYARQITSVIIGFVVFFVVPGTSTLSALVAMATSVAVGFAANAVLARVAPPRS